MTATARTLFEKLWDTHVVEDLGDGLALVHIDRHLLHDLSGPFSLEAISDRGLACLHPELTFAMADHGVATDPDRRAESNVNSARLLPLFRHHCERFGISLFDLGEPQQGIVHVVGPELGLSLPGTSVVCGDSHTCTQGALGALAWGIGSTEVTQVLATQALVLERPSLLRVDFEGELGPGVVAKDLILHLIGREGADAGAGHAMEFAGPVVEALSMEARMTLCNLAVEIGARFGLVAPDDTTFSYVEGRRFAPKGSAWNEAVASWRRLKSDPGARYDRVIRIDATQIAPQITWGTSPAHVVDVTGRVPDPDAAASPAERESWIGALDYMGLRPGTKLEGLAVQCVFIGSCTNGRITDLRAAAEIARGRKVAAGVRALVVPGSGLVKQQAEAEGLDAILEEAGFEWREPGCSMCMAINGDQVPAGARCVSTSNRNFVGRQGPGARTHLASPAMAACAAIRGCISDVRTIGEG